jgi:hypothetical protein
VAVDLLFAAFPQHYYCIAWQASEMLRDRSAYKDLDRSTRKVLFEKHMAALRQEAERVKGGVVVNPDVEEGEVADPNTKLIAKKAPEGGRSASASPGKDAGKKSSHKSSKKHKKRSHKHKHSHSSSSSDSDSDDDKRKSRKHGDSKRSRRD